ncbi:hypothetical protein MMC16_004906 [Acarospora aff. strigata]|nr:hypothetical protein [Acarospora aff. strigata]
MLASDGSHHENNDYLTSKLAVALPQGIRVLVHHVSSHPAECAAIFAAPLGQKPEKTFCESHFIALSVAPSSAKSELFIYAIEILIFTTEHLTTLFVSKADSTGYSHVLATPTGTPSLIKTVSSTLISHLVATRQRPGVKLVVSLFARAQDQYLFPGSIENSGKHVLDDRGLVKWWCAVLDPVLRQHPAIGKEHVEGDDNSGRDNASGAKGYLIVPGCDKYETLSFLPPSLKADPQDWKIWSNSHPLQHLALNPSVPLRCLIPHFPDDPKARFLDELDDELPDTQASQNSPVKRNQNGQWRSVKSLDQFWELMAFRQECSSGRLVGFLWLVFTDSGIPLQANSNSNGGSQVSMALKHNGHGMLPTPSQSQQQDSLVTSPHTPEDSSNKGNFPLSPSTSSPARPQVKANTKKHPKRRPLTGPIVPRQPRTKSGSSRSSSAKQPERTNHYWWPKSSRGEIVLPEKVYKRAMDLLLRLDFADQEVAESSTRRWIGEVAVISSAKTWGQLVIGKKQPVDNVFATNGVNTLNGSMVKKKRKSNDLDGHHTAFSTELPVGMMESTDQDPQILELENGQETRQPTVNVLNSGMIRKKPKVRA